MAVIDLDLSEIVDGYVGNPDVAVAVPVYDAERDEIANYIGYYIDEDDPQKPYRLKVGGLGGNIRRYDYSSSTEAGLRFTTALCGVSPNWNLLFVIRSVMQAVGYQVDLTEYEVPPYNRIFLACPAASMVDALPHWTVKEFLEQVQNFLCAAVDFDPARKRISFRPRKRVPREEHEYQACDEFSAETLDEEEVQSTLTTNLVYARADVDFHVYDFIDDDVLESLPKAEYDGYDAMLAAYNAAGDDDKKNTLWVCPQGVYAHWVLVEGSRGAGDVARLVRVNVFGRYVRDSNYGDTELKIAPAAMADDIECPIYTQKTSNVRGGAHRLEWTSCMYGKMPVIERRLTSRRIYNASVQEILEGSEAEQDETSKPDRIDVMLVDGRLQHYKTDVYRGEDVPGEPVPMGYTSYDYKNENGVEHERWSLSLNPSARLASVGDVHDGKSVVAKHKFLISFLADSIPPVGDYFVFKGKRFLAEKIEAGIVNGQLDRLMTGYFFEAL